MNGTGVIQNPPTCGGPHSVCPMTNQRQMVFWVFSEPYQEPKTYCTHLPMSRVSHGKGRADSVPGTFLCFFCSISNAGPSWELAQETPSCRAGPSSPCSRHFSGLYLFISGSGVPPKAVLELDPPWSTAFKGEIVTVRCMDFNSLTKRPTTWWQNGKVLKKVSEIIQIKSSGDYQCKTPGSSLSDPVHVEFSSGEERLWEILIVKPFIGQSVWRLD